MDITNTLDTVDGFKHEPMKPGSFMQNKWNKNMSILNPHCPYTPETTSTAGIRCSHPLNEIFPMIMVKIPLSCI